MIRVLSISTLFPNAARPGFGLFVARQMQALARRGDVEVVMVSPVAIAPPPTHRLINSPQERALPASAHEWGVEVHYPRFTWLPRIGSRWNAAMIARAVMPLARRLHAQAPFDLVDAQFFFPDGPTAARIARELDLPLSIKARGSDIHLWSNVPHARRQILTAAQQSAGMLAVSEALKRDMAALGMAGEKITVHYTGLDHARFRPIPRAEARHACQMIVPYDGPLLVCVGNLIAIKGQDLAITALKQIPAARLVLAGKGQEEARLRALAARLGLKERVHFTGSLASDALARLLAAADAMVLPSEREGLANAWIEALACGTPLVITDVGGAREVVTSSTAGRLVERDPTDIARAVLELLASPLPQEQVAAHAARFSWEANGAQLTDHYARISRKG